MVSSVREYICTRHRGPVPRELLMAKKVLFVEMGVGGRTQRSRVVDWLCPDCLVQDSDWNRPAKPGSPRAPIDPREEEVIGSQSPQV